MRCVIQRRHENDKNWIEQILNTSSRPPAQTATTVPKPPRDVVHVDLRRVHEEFAAAPGQLREQRALRHVPVRVRVEGDDRHRDRLALVLSNLPETRCTTENAADLKYSRRYKLLIVQSTEDSASE